MSIAMKITTCKLLAATLLIGSSLSGVRTVLAQTQTAAGTTISNTATATYSDGTTTYNATSNTVTVQVAEVPGINVAAQAPSNAAPNANDPLHVDFTITNVGNDPTQFFIPGTATLNTTDFFVDGPLQIIAVNGTAITPVPIPTAGDSTGTLLGATQGSIAANGTITVRVPVRVRGTAVAGATTTVALGNTATANDQNIDRTGNVNNTLDVYTVDNPDGTTGETPGVLSRVHEAMATSTAITVNARLQAFATILKAVSSYSNNNTPAVLSDDTLNYSLALKVATPTPLPTGLVASDLHPTALNLNGSSQDRILVSDAIPDATVLSSTTPTAPDSSWTVVYTISPLSTPAHQAAWVTTRPTSGTITRVGFVRSTPVANNSTPIEGFSFSVNPTASFTGGRIANIAQVFGQSQPGTVAPGTATQLVYDESGDQSANNQLEGGNPDPATTGGAPATGRGIDDGVADVVTDGEDPGKGSSPTAGNTNQGDLNDSDGGEVTLYTIAATPLNGPVNRPDAVNTTNNDDFTNRSIQLPADLNPATPLTDAQTPAITFTNTVQNTSGSPQTISLLPTPPTNAADLPPGTLVTITAGSDVAVYRYNGATFDFEPTGSSNTGLNDPVELVDLPANDNNPGGTDQRNYTVTIDLPDSTVANPIAQNTGFPVLILAFVDQNNDGSPTNEPGNTTINRLYTGYVELQKDARILDGGTEVVGFGASQAALNAAARPGRTIEYRIRYRNVSTLAPANSGSIDLPANSLTITEDGLDAPNNWFNPTTHSSLGPAPGYGIASGTITVTLNGTDIQIYTNQVGTVAPQGTGEFIFRRTIK
ncbi:cell surface protein [Leptolyngbya sp. NIES-2104]|nr:cell surface protein [Leptolyngbya sp. NIES-2104]